MRKRKVDGETPKERKRKGVSPNIIAEMLISQRHNVEFIWVCTEYVCMHIHI